MIANMSAFALARYWRHTPIYEALLEQDGIYLDPKHKPSDPEAGGAVPDDGPNEELPLAE
jgi:hypothetical protein